jgi:Holliday junction resolvase
MPKFCPECGKQVEFSEAKFCPHCGFKLILEKQPETVQQLSEPIQPELPAIKETEVIKESKPIEEMQEKIEIEGEKPIPRFDPQELGKKLEEAVEKILQAEGYTTKKRERILGKSGVKHEIDIVAFKKQRKVAVECKNYSYPVSIDKVTHFTSKVEELGFKNRIFASYSDFTREARNWAMAHDVQLWGREELAQRFLAIHIGRLVEGKTERLKYALPQRVRYDEAVKLELRNANKVAVSSAKLHFLPYYKVYYDLLSQTKDPTRKVHQIRDSGCCIIDAIDGEIMNMPDPEKSGGLDSLSPALSGKVTLFAKKIAQAAATVGIKDEAEEHLILKELQFQPEEDYEISGSEEYEVKVLKPNIIEQQAIGKAIQAIIYKNTQRIEYEIKRKRKAERQRKRDDFDIFGTNSIFDEDVETGSYVFTPPRKDIKIRRIQLVYLPKWEIEFVSGQEIYSREMFAYSGSILSDTISTCPNHTLTNYIDIAPLRKVTVAVCEVCGKALCEKHIFPCSTCGKWNCQEHGLPCEDCKTWYCPEHIPKKCIICNSALCDSCAYICPICGQNTCRKHQVECDKCKTKVCNNCSITTSKFLIKKSTCKKCQ